MSSHQRAAGTRQWKRRLSSSGRSSAHLDGQRLTAVGARRLDPAVRVQRGADPERVPGAVRVPPAAVRLNPIRRRHGRERIRHPDLGRRRVEHERVLLVQPLPAADDVGLGELAGSPRPRSPSARDRARRTGRRSDDLTRRSRSSTRSPVADRATVVTRVTVRTRPDRVHGGRRRCRRRRVAQKFRFARSTATSGYRPYDPGPFDHVTRQAGAAISTPPMQACTTRSAPAGSRMASRGRARRRHDGEHLATPKSGARLDRLAPPKIAAIETRSTRHRRRCRGAPRLHHRT